MATKPVGQFIYQVYVNEVLYKGTAPIDVRLIQEWGSHEIFMMRIEYPKLIKPSVINSWPDDSPIRIVWGRKPDNINTFYGYVNHHTDTNPSDSGSGTYQRMYYIIGTSKPMNSDTSKNWGTVTPTYIAKSIAQKYGLRSVLTKTNWVLPQETQANTSDFQYMNYLAQKTGFRFWVSGGTLYFIDPAVVLISSNSASGVPVFRQDKNLTRHDSMRKFNMLTGDNLPGSSKTRRSLYGITPQGQIINPSAGSGISNIKSTRNVSSYSEGLNIVNAWQSMAQFYTGATAELYGNVMVYPGKLVNIQGDFLPGSAPGYWIVSKAVHKLSSAYTPDTTQDYYVTEVDMLRNTDTIPSLKQMNMVKPEFIGCNLINSSWKAESAGSFYDGVLI